MSEHLNALQSCMGSVVQGNQILDALLPLGIFDTVLPILALQCESISGF